ncbi:MULTISPECIES: RNA polymerase sigma factor [unclassified Colwellia]|uniref:RNA polymerase sigma factor n=1 Tax=unclassified Colwellia TaxID=196834 RepID=UPI0015F55DAC|nr:MULTISPECIES: sigma-70 family RNA polymerase sigma factor [unclassified Colwellia]MBA6350963.1 sigma-70 family RNA polymerase sigma factor [Colwellia sp. BRX9-1]MBA6356928.1 sigma-70 family RNA polymerase sigma factor [Colwellia sp. BRX8-3]MBA6360834.1 sigma-70 family RNA polymerase sigma factor [Colwellia sp. BRX8-6]MBA6368959.1 sigma-70 family RNA polymerase sigma factor [Colwellia sp. BRX8-5]MBA6374813.1 sigma-70 family RNA polymerase sigma factor [Colwellia sp. BRX8-2]
MSKSALSHALEGLRTQVLNFCQSYLHNLPDAEEACQDTLFKAYQAYSRFEGKSSLKTWVMKIAANVCASFYRSNSKYRATFSDDSFQYAEQLVEAVESPLEFNTLIKTLNHQEKNILQFHFVKGLPLSEIAKFLDINKSTVKMCYYRALNKFESNLLAA